MNHKHDMLSCIRYIALISACHLDEQVEAFRVKKQTTVGEFKQMLADKWDVPVEQQRLWMWATRQNHSVRPSTFLDEKEDDTRVCDVRVCLVTTQLVGIHIYCECCWSDDSPRLWCSCWLAWPQQDSTYEIPMVVLDHQV